MEGRPRPPLKICSNPHIDSVKGNKSLTAAGAHSHSLRNAPKSRKRTSKDAARRLPFTPELVSQVPPQHAAHIQDRL
ncbi:hypothetical protein J2Z66_003405 [Paenibacillus eucommiae]|uniref:Uncharacterized protein n=1 Tax=Paenibacillus eucommiae TaxID=1355755 RepID=A0ABS4IWB2_9BACL|nr:hypothetical protein [Paenibacillus eucommiae]